MNKTKTPKTPWTKGEKFLLGAILLTVALAALGTFWWQQVNTTPVVAIPTPTMPAQNAFDYFNAAASAEVMRNSVEYAIQIGPHPPHPAPGSLDHPYSPQQKAALVQANALALKTLRQGLTYPYQNPPIRSFSTLLPYYAHFRSLARLLSLEGQVREGRGDWGGAANSHLDAVEYGAKIPRGGTEIGMLVGVACEAIGRRPLWAEVDHLSATQARVAIRRLEGIRKLQVSLSDALQEEEWSKQASLMEIYHHPTWRAELTSYLMIASEAYDTELTTQQQASLRFASKRAIMGGYTAVMDAQIRNAQLPYAAPPPSPPSDPIVHYLIADIAPIRLRVANNETQDALLLTTLALHAYRLEHGAYPTTLAALTPAYLKQIPNDPFAASGPMHYKRQGSKYVLYSVGPDGKNDGGKPIFDSTQPAPQPGEHDRRYSVMPDSRGDIVAGVNIF